MHASRFIAVSVFLSKNSGERGANLEKRVLLVAIAKIVLFKQPDCRVIGQCLFQLAKSLSILFQSRLSTARSAQSKATVVLVQRLGTLAEISLDISPEQNLDGELAIPLATI